MNLKQENSVTTKEILFLIEALKLLSPSEKLILLEVIDNIQKNRNISMESQ